MAAMKYCVILVFLYSIPVTATTTVFHTNCTRPPSGSSFNFVTAPNTRGTLEVLWSCLFTLFICTWQVQHLDVPPQDSSSVTLSLRKPVWMLITLLVPELLVGIALSDFLKAKASVRYMQGELPELVERGGWTMTHAFYANMYGFMVRKRAAVEPDLATTPLTINTSMFQPHVILRRDSLVLNAERTVIYYRSLPSPKLFITKADIVSRAKGDIFPKCIAGFQVFWFIIQVCARTAQNVAISQLEIAVLGFAICTLTSYLLWIQKPQDVSLPTVLDEGPEPLPSSNDWYDNRNHGFIWDVYDDGPEAGFINLPLGITVARPFSGICVGGIIFGAIHLLAWNLNFPTHMEKILWRTSSIGTMAIPLWLFILDTFTALYTKFFLRGWILVPVYFIFRLFLIVETFRTLGYLPAGAFATTWSTYMPHVM